jgi:hypothetical protein
MKPIELYAARSHGQLHLFSAETGRSLCGISSPRAKHLSISGLDDISCPICQEKATGLSVVLTNP